MSRAASAVWVRGGVTHVTETRQRCLVECSLVQQSSGKAKHVECFKYRRQLHQTDCRVRSTLRTWGSTGRGWKIDPCNQKFTDSMQCLQVVRAIAIANMELQNFTIVAIYYTFQQYNTGSAIKKVRWKMWFLGETGQVLRGYSESNPSISQWGPEQTMARTIWFPGLYFLKELIQCKVYSTMLIFCLHKLCLSRFIPRSFINYVAVLNGQIY